ncbi:MAG: GNAT family N-acetyltransferase [Pyrinomonadaceae bacterium]
MATSQDEAALLGLINLVQPHVPWTRAHLYWQFFDLPAGPAKLYVIREGAAIVSLYAAIPQILEVDGHLLEARMVQDVMTHPDFRGRGFLHHLASLCLEDISQSKSVGYTFPNDRSEKSFRRGGWSELCKVPHRSKDLSGEVHSRSIVRIDPLVERFGDWATELWGVAGLSVGIRRDAQFLNWRYEKPGNEYHKFLIADDRGVLVVKFYSDGVSKVLHILELVLRTRDRDLLPEVLAFCFHFAAMHGALTVTAWLPSGHPYATQLDAAGLVIKPMRERFVFVHAPAAYASRVEDSTVWHLTQGDSDVF